MSTKQDISNELIYEEEFTWPSKEFRVLGLLAYTPGGFILPYLLWLSDKPFVLFHVKQGFIIFSIFVLVSILPFSGTFGFAFFVYVIICAWHAYHAFNGEEYRMGWVATLIARQEQQTSSPKETASPTPTTEGTETKEESKKESIS